MPLTSYIAKDQETGKNSFWLRLSSKESESCLFKHFFRCCNLMSWWFYKLISCPHAGLTWVFDLFMPCPYGLLKVIEYRNNLDLTIVCITHSVSLTLNNCLHFQWSFYVQVITVLLVFKNLILVRIYVTMYMYGDAQFEHKAALSHIWN